MGKVDKGAPCSVTGCRNKAERSIGKDALTGSGLTTAASGRRLYLCHEHYKAWKKATKKDRAMDRARWG